MTIIRSRPQIPPGAKYKVCDHWREHWKCRSRPCTFALSFEELRYWFQMRVKEEPRPRHPTGIRPRNGYRLCNNYRGYCEDGVHCRFPHSTVELESWKKNADMSKYRERYEKYCNWNLIWNHI